MKDAICTLFNTIFNTLNDRMTKNEFGYVLTNSSILACKTWALAIDWESLLIYDLDHRNAKKVFNNMILWVSTHTSIDNIDEKCEYISILTNSNLFQTNNQVSTCCPNDAAVCKSVKKSYPGFHEEISPYYIGKLKGPPSFTDFLQD